MGELIKLLLEDVLTVPEGDITIPFICLHLSLNINHHWRYVMFSLDKFPDWDMFQMREVPIEVEILSPAAETIALLQSRLTDIRAVQTVSDEKHTAGLDALAQQAVFVVQLEASLQNYKTKFEEANLNKVYRALRIVKDQMLTALQEAGLEVIIPLGKPFDEVAEYVDVLGWRHHEDFTGEVVVES